jgi:ubiquitin-like modifier-activating enzyme 5
MSFKSEENIPEKYARLAALQQAGIITDYKQIHQKSILIVGLGGIGATVAEMLARCGVGKLILFDHDLVEMANMNQLFYRPEHLLRRKVDVAYETLR